MLLIGNGTLITRGAQNRLIENGCVALDGAVIHEIGDTAKLKSAHPGAEFIDARGGLIMPGFINTHHHIYSAMARGLSVNGYAPRSFGDILRGLWWKLDACLEPEDIHLSAMTTLSDCVRCGVTTVFDHHASYGCIRDSLQTIAGAAMDIGIRACLCYEVSDRAGDAAMRDAVRENAGFMEHCAKSGQTRLAGMMGLHASFTLSDAALAHCRDNTPDDAGFHIHVAEGIDDLNDSMDRYGVPTVRRLYDRGILGEKTIAAHCIHIDNAERELLSDTDTIVVNNPESNMGNAVGCTPVVDLLKRGVTVGLGTDGYTSDMLESMKAANCIHKYELRDPAAAWAEVPRMLFVNNAAVVKRFFGVETGVLAPGAQADVTVADYNPPTPLSAGNCDGHLLFGLTGRDVTTTVAGGRVLMKDRQLLCCDPAELAAKSRESAQKLWNRINVRKG